MKEDVLYWFCQAADMAADERESFLESHCPNASVRAEVQSLLAYDVEESPVRSESAVRNAIAAVVGNTLGVRQAPAERVGAFELGRVLGSGGMGLVYEAHRVDGQVRQRVAVKFAQVSITASEKFRQSVNRRFHRERQILASLRHPYIAGLIDAGTTGDGTPYAVIEQVEGVPIDAYCDEHLPDPEDRIRLIIKLCDAVQCAHRNLIIHSDIKPENVLVTADGIPKLIDFGVASDLGDDGPMTTMRAFTPGYASPEQLRAMPSTVATDVYGVGALLYRLLTGFRPHHDRAGRPEQTLHKTADDDVVRPSAIKPHLKGDLENILLKALQPEPHRRYGSVPELAEDLNRFLAHQPVRATPDSTLYRTSRFIRRHWVFVLIAALSVLVLVGSTFVFIQQRKDATRRAQETRSLSETLLFEVHDQIRELVGATKARETLGVIAVQYLETLERDQGLDPELAWELLNAYGRLGQSRGGSGSSVGDTNSALQLAEKTMELGAVVEAATEDTDRLDQLFNSYASLVGIFEEAERTAERREVVERMLRLSSKLSELRRAQALKEHARWLAEQGSSLEAASTFAETAGLLRQQPTDSAVESELITTLVGLGRSQAASGNFIDALNSLQEAERRATNRTVFDPHLVRTARQLYWTHVSLGDILGLPLRFNLGRTDQAAVHYEKARDIAENLVSADPANEVARIDLARALGRQGATLAVAQPQRALNLIERSESVLLRASSRNHTTLDTRLALLTSSIVPLVRLRQFDRARHNVQEARRLLARMQQAGIRADEKSILKAESIRLHAEGQHREALEQARRHLALLPEKVSTVLSENYETVEVLERIQSYAAGVESGACAAAGNRLAHIWESLQSAYPKSAFVRAQMERARASETTMCLAPVTLALAHTRQ
jgi:serine/threonine protein kinase/tetratricopeptide (TPR) repeat protein